MLNNRPPSAVRGEVIFYTRTHYYHVIMILPPRLFCRFSRENRPYTRSEIFRNSARIRFHCSLVRWDQTHRGMSGKNSFARFRRIIKNKRERFLSRLFNFFTETLRVIRMSLFTLPPYATLLRPRHSFMFYV